MSVKEIHQGISILVHVDTSISYGESLDIDVELALVVEDLLD